MQALARWARSARLWPALLGVTCVALASLQFVLLPPRRRRQLRSRLTGGSRDQSPQSDMTVSIGCYNVLCSTYAVKWNEREGIGPDGASNWATRWPVMRDIMLRAQWDVICLQEVEHADVDEIVAGLGGIYQAKYFKHERRPPDGLLIAVRRELFEDIEFSEMQYNGVAFGRVDMKHRASRRELRVVTCHARGGNVEQLAALNKFADSDAAGVDLTVVTGDFNEDFAADSAKGIRCPFPDSQAGRYHTLRRENTLPRLSRPPHKQEEDQKSGKGKVDWIFVRGKEADLFRDQASFAAILESHAPCEATGQWPSDHGAEALSVWLFPL